MTTNAEAIAEMLHEHWQGQKEKTERKIEELERRIDVYAYELSQIKTTMLEIEDRIPDNGESE